MADCEGSKNKLPNCCKQHMSKDKISQANIWQCLAAGVVYLSFFNLMYSRAESAAIYPFIFKLCFPFLLAALVAWDRNGSQWDKEKFHAGGEVLMSVLQSTWRKASYFRVYLLNYWRQNTFSCFSTEEENRWDSETEQIPVQTRPCGRCLVRVVTISSQMQTITSSG